MSDILKAIEKEQEYLSYRRRGEEPYSLGEALKEFGFKSLSEYAKAKKDYEFSQLPFVVIETTPLKAIAEVLKVILEKRTAVLFADTITTIVWNGDNSKYNESYCITHGIPVLPTQTEGGTLVSTKGDLNIGICLPRSAGIGVRDILLAFSNIFRKYTDKEVKVDGNDVLVDGHKVLGAASYHTKEMLMFITPVSLTEKTELINNICIKNSSKNPSHIDFMSAELLRKEVLEWLQIK